VPNLDFVAASDMKFLTRLQYIHNYRNEVQLAEDEMRGRRRNLWLASLAKTFRYEDIPT